MRGTPLPLPRMKGAKYANSQLGDRQGSTAAVFTPKGVSRPTFPRLAGGAGWGSLAQPAPCQPYDSPVSGAGNAEQIATVLHRESRAGGRPGGLLHTGA